MNLYIAYTPDSFSSFIPNGIWLKFQPIITEVINKEKPNKKIPNVKKLQEFYRDRPLLHVAIVIMNLRQIVTVPVIVFVAIIIIWINIWWG